MEYELLQQIGKGSYGSVYRARHRLTDAVYAVKRMDVRRSTHYETVCIVNELRVLSSHKCPFIIAFKTAFMHENCIHIVTELATQGDLAALVKRRAAEPKPIAESEVWSYFLQLAIGVSYLHAINVIHRDLKPANVFLDGEGRIKLGDVGVVKLMRCYMMWGQTQVGTPLYMSPEIIRRERYDKRVDVWSVGCIVHELMSLTPPFAARNMFELRACILSGRWRPPPLSYSQELRGVVAKMMAVQPRLRPDLDALLRRPSVASPMKDRGLELFLLDRAVQPLFHRPCAVPRRLPDWQQVVGMFCELNATIRLDDNAAERMKAVANLKRVLDAPPPSQVPRVATAARRDRVAPSRAPGDDVALHAEIRRVRGLLEHAQSCVAHYRDKLQRLLEKRCVT